MDARVDHLLLEALALAPEERSLVALSLLHSLQSDGATDQAVTESWVSEARRRNEDITDGRTKAVPVEEFRNWFNSL
ncbi:addiction module protein [Aquabacterium sp.]|uniref:addiction module protein n=1 Tax=Aquabacterium sp. TaxID=1872578 RepID=UPI0019A07F9E|nr:addiction module protein [Aquabacterium sp.]MBC7699496.1 addiction module protein [Aquabacterium sp.]